MARWSSSASAPTLATTASGTPMPRAASASHRRPPLTLTEATGLVAESLPASPSSVTAASGASEETDDGAAPVVAGR